MAKALSYSVTLISTSNYVLKACEEMAKTFEHCGTIKKELDALKAQLAGMREKDEKMKFLQGTGMLENREFLVKRATLAGKLQERCRNLETLVAELQAKLREEEQAKLRRIHTTAWLQSESSSYLRERNYVLREKRTIEKRVIELEKELYMLGIERKFFTERLRPYERNDPQMRLLTEFQRKLKRKEELKRRSIEREMEVPAFEDDIQYIIQEPEELEEDSAQLNLREWRPARYQGLDPYLQLDIDPFEEEELDSREEDVKARGSSGSTKRPYYVPSSLSPTYSPPDPKKPKRNDVPPPQTVAAQRARSKTRGSPRRVPDVRSPFGIPSRVTTTANDRSSGSNLYIQRASTQDPPASRSSINRRSLQGQASHHHSTTAKDVLAPSADQRNNASAQSPAIEPGIFPASPRLEKSSKTDILDAKSDSHPLALRSPMYGIETRRVSRKAVDRDSAPSAGASNPSRNPRSSDEVESINAGASFGSHIVSTSPGKRITPDKDCRIGADGLPRSKAISKAVPISAAVNTTQVKGPRLGTYESSSSLSPNAKPSSPLRLDAPKSAMASPQKCGDIKDSPGLHLEGGVHTPGDVSPRSDKLQMDPDPQDLFILSPHQTLPDPYPQNSEFGEFSDGISPAISRTTSPIRRIGHLGPSIGFPSSGSEDRTEDTTIKDVSISRITHGQSRSQEDAHVPATSPKAHSKPTPHSSVFPLLPARKMATPPKRPIPEGKTKKWQEKLEKGDGQGGKNNKPILIFIPSADAMTQALEDHRVKQEVEKGLPKSIIKLLYECLESGGKTIRTTNAINNSGGDFKSCVYSQKKNRNGKETAVRRGRFHRCRRCTNEKQSCLYLFEERFGYIMQPIPQDPREREVGVEYQPLAPGLDEEMTNEKTRFWVHERVRVENTKEVMERMRMELETIETTHGELYKGKLGLKTFLRSCHGPSAKNQISYL